MSPDSALALSLLVDAAVLGALVMRSRAPIAAARLWSMFGLALACALGQAAFVALVSRRYFLALHVLHGFLFLALPAAGVLVATGWPRRATRAARATAAAGALLLLAVGIDSSWIEPARLLTVTATVAISPQRAGREELRIGVLSDIQCDRVGDHERRAIEQVMAERPDLILLAGDLTQVGSDEQARALQPEMRALLGGLHAPLGVFCVPGDTDSVDGLLEMLQGTDVRLLCNEIVPLTHGDRRITLGGVVRDPTSAVGRGVVQRLSAPGGDDLRLLLAHKPDWALLLPEGGRIDLVVAGHTHGGQVQLPGIGPLITLTRVPRAMAAGGLHELRGSPLYVTRGVGFERGDAPRVRFHCPPEISVLTLRTAEASDTAP